MFCVKTLETDFRVWNISFDHKGVYHMKYRTYARFAALALSLTLLTACGPKEENDAQSNPDGSISSSQGSASIPEQSQPDLSLPESSQPDASQPDASLPDKNQEDSENPPVEEPVAKKSLSLNSSDFSLFKVGAAYQLKAESKPEKGTYTWTSDNEAVAKVSNKGLVTAVAPGNATITVTDSKTGLTASCIVRCKFEADKPASGGSASSGSGSSSSGGNSSSGSGSVSTPNSGSVDLSAFYSTVTSNHQFGMLSLADANMIKDVYPGLSDVKTNQCLPYINMMTMNSGEIALVEVASSGDVDTVKGVFQDRIDAQVAGGAFYPSAIETWQNNSRVVSKGNYVMMVVHEDCDAIVNEFNALF